MAKGLFNEERFTDDIYTNIYILHGCRTYEAGSLPIRPRANTLNALSTLANALNTADKTQKDKEEFVQERKLLCEYKLVYAAPPRTLPDLC
eukprot:scaffold67766_cov52-Cyclotella_meneghiniana.AAC.4